MQGRRSVLNKKLLFSIWQIVRAFIIGYIFFQVLVWIFYYRAQYLHTHGKRARGTVVRVAANTTIEFKVGDRYYEGSEKSMGDFFSVGDIFEVVYDPDSPSNCYIDYYHFFMPDPSKLLEATSDDAYITESFNYFENKKVYQIRYTYIVNGRRYSKTRFFKEKPILGSEGKTYKVRYLKANPSSSFIMLD